MAVRQGNQSQAKNKKPSSVLPVPALTPIAVAGWQGAETHGSETEVKPI